jgi:hypothetical protein
VGADALEHRHEVHRLGEETAGEDGAAVDEDGGTVQARDGHEAAGHVLVTAADGHEAVEHLAAHHGLDRVGDNLARDERIFHSLGAHGNAIGNGDGVEDESLAAGFGHAFRRRFRELVDVDVAGGDLTPGGGDADLRFLEVTALESDRV